MKVCAVSLLLVGSFLTLRAQSEALQLPQGPLLKRALAPAEWVTTTRAVKPPGAAPPSAPAKSKTVTVIKVQDFIYEKSISEQGAEFETWRISGGAASRSNGGGWAVSAGRGNNFDSTDYSKTDFAGFDWIALGNFTGRGNVMGKKCIIFKAKVVIMDSHELKMEKEASGAKVDDQFKVDVEADIDEQTRLPVLLTYHTPNGVMERSYVFSSPDGTPSPPVEVVQLIKKYNEILRRMSVRVAPI